MYESGGEARFLYVLLAMPDVADVREQAPRVEFRDQRAPVAHVHTFDALVTERGGRRVAYEYKPASLVTEELLVRLGMVAAQMPADLADGVRLVTERDLAPAWVADARMLAAARLDPAGPEDLAVMSAMAATRGSVSVSDLMRASRTGGQGCRAILRLLANRVLVREPGGRFSHDTRVSLPRDAGGER